MKLSEFKVNPIWDNAKKQYTNDISKDIIDSILFDNIEDTSVSCKYCILLGISRKIEAIARAQVVARLYKEGRVKKILITGGKNGIYSCNNSSYFYYIPSVYFIFIIFFIYFELF